MALLAKSAVLKFQRALADRATKRLFYFRSTIPLGVAAALVGFHHVESTLFAKFTTASAMPKTEFAARLC